MMPLFELLLLRQLKQSEWFQRELHIKNALSLAQKKILREGRLIKKWQATYIAPLQPLTLAAFPPWGSLQELVV